MRKAGRFHCSPRRETQLLNRRRCVQLRVTLRTPHGSKHVRNFDVHLATRVDLCGLHSPRHFHARVATAKATALVTLVLKKMYFDLRFPHMCMMDEYFKSFAMSVLKRSKNFSHCFVFRAFIHSSKPIFFICILGDGIRVHSALRPPMAYCASPG
jgi:hypothetical protein